MSPSLPRSRNFGLRVIAAIKFGKGLLLAGVGLGLFRLINQDVGEVMRKWTFRLRIDPENTYVHWLLRHLAVGSLLEKFGNVNPKTLRHVGWVLFLFAADLMTEGVGLWLNQTWAKYLVLGATGVFIPWEVYGCIHRPSWEYAASLALNIAVVGYLVHFLWHDRRKPGSPSA